MSYDIYVWAGPPLDTEEIAERLSLVDEGLDENSVFDRSETLVRWRNDVLRKHPALEDLTDDVPKTPWATTPVESARFVELNFQWDVPEPVLTEILTSALSTGFYVYDPQGPTVVKPGPARWQVGLRKLGLAKFAGHDG